MRIHDRFPGWRFVLAALLLAGCAPPQAPERELTLFAAASLIEVAEELVRAFESEHAGYRVAVHAAASSVLARQIDAGAPADAFFLANEAWSDFLVERGRVDGPILVPISNRLVVVARDGQSTIADLAAFPETASLALADPEHVPAGLYAREALTCLGLWERLAPAGRPALDVRAALHAVEQGAADFAIVYATDVGQTDAVALLFAIPDACQPAIRYTLGRLKASPDADGAAALVAYLAAGGRRAAWERHGFVVCGGAGKSVAAPC